VQFKLVDGQEHQEYENEFSVRSDEFEKVYDDGFKILQVSNPTKFRFIFETQNAAHQELMKGEGENVFMRVAQLIVQ